MSLYFALSSFGTLGVVHGLLPWAFVEVRWWCGIGEVDCV